jgi:hypothetical protein
MYRVPGLARRLANTPDAIIAGAGSSRQESSTIVVPAQLK